MDKSRMISVEANSTRRHCMVVFNEYPLGETRVQREAEALVRNGYEVDVICKRMPDEQAIDIYKGVHIYREIYHFPVLFIKSGGLGQRFLDYIRFFFSAAYRLIKLYSLKHYDSIQVHNLPDFLVFCTFLQKIRGVPVILDLHDLMPEFFAGRFGERNSWLARLIRWQERSSCKFADHVITVSEHWRQALIQRGVPANKCSVVMNVADDNIFRPVGNKHIRLSGNNEFRMIYHGNMVQRYGLDLAVQAVALLRDEIPGIHLTLIGQGEFLSDLQRMVEQLQLHKNISIEPKHLAEELPDIILSCDLGIVPYRSDIFTDGLLPTKLMEYAALGMPVVAARTTAIKAYFSDTNTEFFEPGNVTDLARCIRFLYHNPDQLDKLGRGSQKFNQQYNWTKISSEYVALVQRLERKHEKVGEDKVQHHPRNSTS